MEQTVSRHVQYYSWFFCMALRAFPDPVRLTVNKELDAEATVEGVDGLFSQEGVGETSSQDPVDSSVSEDEESVSVIKRYFSLFLGNRAR